MLTSLVVFVLSVLLVINPWHWAVVLTGLLYVGFIAMSLRNLFITLGSSIHSNRLQALIPDDFVITYATPSIIIIQLYSCTFNTPICL